MKNFLIILFLIFFIKNNYAQNNIDSLKNLLQTCKNENQKIETLNNISWCYRKKNIDSSLKYGNFALEMAKKNNNKKQISNSLNKISVAYLLAGILDKSIEIQLQALRIREEIKDSVGIAQSYDNLVISHQYRKEYEKAIFYILKSEKIYLKFKDTIGLRRSYSNMAAMNSKIEKYKKAKYYQKKSFEFIPKDNLRNLLRYYINFGNIYISQFQKNKLNFTLLDTALYYYSNGIKIAKKLKDDRSLGNFYNSMGAVAGLKKDYKKSLEYFKLSYLYVTKMKNIYLEKNILNNLSQSFAKRKQFDSAYYYANSFKEISDSIISIEKNKQLIEMETKYETEKKEKENIILKKNKEKQEITIQKQKIAGFSILIFLILAIIIAIWFFKLKRKQEKANKSLQEKNIKIKKQRNEIQKNHRKITDSINYASRIQNALLPNENDFKENLKKHFIFYKPKNIVSGDFYYFKKINEYIIIAAADCTGHGVPGAFVSMLGIAFLNEIIRKKEIKTAAEVLEELRIYVKTSLKQKGENYDETKDGMDIAMCVINEKTNILQFAGAYNSLYLVRDNELKIIKATRNPIGIFLKEKPFVNNIIQLNKNDKLYMFSDGYIDQFGGKKGRKFQTRNFNKLILKISNENFSEQKQILEKTIERWKNGIEQNDDILIIGIGI